MMEMLKKIFGPSESEVTDRSQESRVQMQNGIGQQAMQPIENEYQERFPGNFLPHNRFARDMQQQKMQPYKRGLFSFFTKARADLSNLQSKAQSGLTRNKIGKNPSRSIVSPHSSTHIGPSSRHSYPHRMIPMYPPYPPQANIAQQSRSKGFQTPHLPMLPQQRRQIPLQGSTKIPVQRYRRSVPGPRNFY